MWKLLCVWLAAWMAQPGSPALQLPRSAGPGQPAWELFLEQLSVQLRKEEYSTLAFLCFESATSPCSATRMLRTLGGAAHTAVMLLHPAQQPSGPLNGKTAYVITSLDSGSCDRVEKLTNSSRAAVVLMSFQEEGETEMASAFQACWRDRFPNVIAVLVNTTQRGSVAIYTYEPFLPGTCHSASLRFVKVWAVGSPLGTFKEIGLSGKANNLNGCALRMTTIPVRPWTAISWDKKKKKFKFGGSLLPLVKSLSSYMNFTVTVSPPEGSMVLGTAETCPKCRGVYGDLFHNRSDLAVVMTYKRSIPTPYHVQILTSKTTCATWCLPTGYPPRSMSHLLFGEFSHRLWYVLVATFAVSAYLFWLLSRLARWGGWGRPMSRSQAAMLALRALLGGSAAPFRPSTHAMRVFFLGWSFFSTILATLYGAVLRSYVVAERDATVFQSVEDIVDANIPFFLPAERMHFFHRPPLSDTGIEGPIMRRAIPFRWEDATTLIQNFTRRRDFSVFVERDTCLSLARFYTPPRHPSVFHVLRGHCGQLLRRSVSFVTVLARSPLLLRLREVLARLDEAGLTAFWTRKPVAPGIKAPRSAAPLRIIQVLPFLFLLKAGLLVAALAFFGELLSSRLAALWARRGTARRLAGHGTGRGVGRGIGRGAGRGGGRGASRQRLISRLAWTVSGRKGQKAELRTEQVVATK